MTRNRTRCTAPVRIPECAEKRTAHGSGGPSRCNTKAMPGSPIKDVCQIGRNRERHRTVVQHTDSQLQWNRLHETSEVAVSPIRCVRRPARFASGIKCRLSESRTRRPTRLLCSRTGVRTDTPPELLQCHLRARPFERIETGTALY
jgi:hypothetical protein